MRFQFLVLMRTNIDLDDVILKKAMKFSKIEVKKELINKLLKEYVLYQERLKILDLPEAGTWIGNLNEMRTDAKWSID